jgi:hypothetical protein
MRGRGEEFETVLGLLDSTQQGQGQVLLVEGEPGTGKSLLLAQAGEEAGHRGFLLVVAAAGELSPAPLLAAVNAARATPRGPRRGTAQAVTRRRRPRRGPTWCSPGLTFGPYNARCTGDRRQFFDLICGDDDPCITRYGSYKNASQHDAEMPLWHGRVSRTTNKHAR